MGPMKMVASGIWLAGHSLLSSAIENYDWEQTSASSRVGVKYWFGNLLINDP